MDHIEFLAEIGRKGGKRFTKKKQEQFKEASAKRWEGHVKAVKHAKNKK